MLNRIIVGTSNLNMPLRDLLGGRQQYERFLEQGEYDGYQLMPVRGKGPLYRVLAQAGRVLSAQESWVLFGNILPALSQKDGLRRAAESLAVTAVFPSMAASHKQLRRMQAAAYKVGIHLPIIVHPDDQKPPARRTLSPGIPDPSWQLTSELLDAWGIGTDITSDHIKDFARLINRAREAQGLGKITLDTNHAAFGKPGEARRPIPHIAQLAGALAAKGLIEQVEISLRPDFGGTTSDIAMVRDGHLAGTIHGQILDHVAANTPPGKDLRVITEVRAGAIAAPLMEFHASLVDQIHAIAHPYLPHAL